MSAYPECPICGYCSELQSTVSLPKFLHRIDAKVSFCRYCRVGITEPPPSVDICYYQESTFLGSKRLASRRLLKKYDEIAATLCSFLSASNYPSSKAALQILDVGAGTGNLARFIQERYPNSIYYAIEPSAQNRQLLLSMGLIVYPSLNDLLLHNLTGVDGFNVIIYSSVIEHLRDPVTSLLASKALLRNGGCIFLSQADYSGLLPFLFPQFWYGWQPIEHFYHFTFTSLRFLAVSIDMNPTFLSRSSLHQSIFSSSVIKFLPQFLIFLLSSISKFLGKGDLVNVVFIKK